MTETLCPICDQPATFFCEKTQNNTAWEVFRCTSCGHGFIQNRPTPQELVEIYAIDETTSEGESSDVESRKDCIRMVHQLKGLGAKTGRSLDVGSGDGAFSHHLAKAGFTPLMIDHGIHAEKAAAGIPNSSFWRIGFEEYSSDPTKPRPLEVIVMSQVLEHALDPMDWLRRSKDLLATGGILAVAVPNFASIYRFRGERDPFIIPPQHLNYFTPKSLALAMTKAGLAHLATRYRSDIATSHPLHKMPLKRKLIGHLWNNTAARVIDLAGQGIILCSFAVRQA